jgi:glycosyltransferase involved in cell wall biosynthesis
LPAGLRDRGTLLLVGDGPEKEALTSFVRSHRIHNVRFLGHATHDEVIRCLAASDVFVFPTLEDVWGLAVSEAMATGKPVLCSLHAGCVRELVQDGANGYTFEPHDHVHFSSLLGKLLAKPELLPDMGKRSREIISGFTIERSTSEWHKALLSLQEKSCGAPRP